MGSKRTSRTRRDASRPADGRSPALPDERRNDLLDEYLKTRIRRETFRGADGSIVDGAILLERLYDARRPRSRRPRRRS